MPSNSTIFVALVSAGRRTRNQITSSAETQAHPIAAATRMLLRIHDAIDVLALVVGDDDVAERVDGAGVATATARQRHRRKVGWIRRWNAVPAAATDLSRRRPPRRHAAVAIRRRASLRVV